MFSALISVFSVKSPAVIDNGIFLLARITLFENLGVTLGLMPFKGINPLRVNTVVQVSERERYNHINFQIPVSAKISHKIFRYIFLRLIYNHQRRSRPSLSSDVLTSTNQS